MKIKDDWTNLRKDWSILWSSSTRRSRTPSTKQTHLTNFLKKLNHLSKTKKLS